MENDAKVGKLQAKHDAHVQYNWREDRAEHRKYWRAWGSWFSWGSPVGLGLGYALILLSTGGFLWILAKR